MDGGMPYADVPGGVAESAKRRLRSTQGSRHGPGTPARGSPGRTAPADPGDPPNRPAPLGTGLPLRQPQAPQRQPAATTHLLSTSTQLSDSAMNAGAHAESEEADEKRPQDTGGDLDPFGTGRSSNSSTGRQ